MKGKEGYMKIEDGHEQKNSAPTKAVVCFLEKDGHILLARKKAKIGVGLWNGYGGLWEDEDTSLEDTVRREVHEETNKAISLEGAEFSKIGVVVYHNHKQDDRRKVVEVHFFLVRGWSGTLPEENDEMGCPQWFLKHELPYDEMMPSDKAWLPKALQGVFIEGEVFHTAHNEVESQSFKQQSTPL